MPYITVEKIKNSEDDYFINEFIVTDDLKKTKNICIYLHKKYTIRFYDDKVYNVDGIEYVFVTAKPSIIEYDYLCNEDYYSHKFIDYIIKITPLYESAIKNGFKTNISDTSISELTHFLETKIIDLIIYNKEFHKKIFEFKDKLKIGQNIKILEIIMDDYNLGCVFKNKEVYLNIIEVILNKMTD